jgi:hypothetical protein
VPPSYLRRLFRWALLNKAVAAIVVAGLISAGFLAVNIAAEFRVDYVSGRAALESSKDAARAAYADDSSSDIAARGASRSSTRNSASGNGHADASGQSVSTDTPGEVDVYIASDAAWRDGTFAASFEQGGEPWDGDSAAQDDQDDHEKERQSADDSPFDEDATEEPYPRNGFIGGRILSDTGMALVGIGVTATATHLFDVPPTVTVPVGDLQRQAISDTAGSFRFEQLAAGEYRINNVPTETYGRAQIAVRTGVDFANLVLKGQRQFSVSGIVTDLMGQPLAAALVQPQALGSKGAYTDSTGRFELQLQVPTEVRGLGVRTTLYGYRSKMSLLAA